MSSVNDLYEVTLPEQSIINNEESADDDDEDEETMYEDLLDHNDLVTAQLVSAGPVGLAAAAAIASGKKRRRLHSFETNPSIRKRQQTRLLRKLCSLMEEYIVRVGQQAVIICCSPNTTNQNSSFRVFGSQPLEGIVRGQKATIINDLEKLMSLQPIRSESNQLDRFELPPLSVEGVLTSLERMTQAQLRYFIPEMLKYATGKSKPGWGKPECKPIWWPDDVPWANVRSDVRDEETKKRTSWTLALRKIVKSCYEHHGRDDLLNASISQQQVEFASTSRNTEGSNASCYLDNSFHENELVPGPSVVVQQVTNPDGSTKMVQLDTSGLSITKSNNSLASFVGQQSSQNMPFKNTSEAVLIKKEISQDGTQCILLLDAPRGHKKIIRLTRKRHSPSELSQPTPCSQLDGSNCLQAALPRGANISVPLENEMENFDSNCIVKNESDDCTLHLEEMC